MSLLMQPGGHICDAAVTTRNCPESIRAKGHLARSLGMCPPGMVKKVSLIADGEYGTLAPSATTPGICPVYPGGHSGTNPQFTGHLVSCSEGYIRPQVQSWPAQLLLIPPSPASILVVFLLQRSGFVPSARASQLALCPAFRILPSMYKPLVA